jgi:hypothetical protein
MTRPAKQETPKDVRRRLNRRLQVESADLAVEALEEVAKDKRAPAPARATAGVALLRAAGYLDKRERDAEEKEPHEMSAEEIAEQIERLRGRAVELSEVITDNDEDVFD